MSSESEQERSTSGEIQAGGEELDGEMDVTPEESESGLSEKLSESLVFSNQTRPQDHDRVPLWRKIAYGVGAMPYAMCSTVIGFYFSIFLLEVVILDPVYVLIILFSGRVWDAITDPMVGYLTSLTQTRFGRLRPWLAGSMVPSGVLYFFLFFVPPLDDYPQYYKFIYYLIMYLLYEASLSCIHVPFTALTVHISNNARERDIVTLVRMCFEVTSTLLGIGIHTLFFTIFVVGAGDQCEQERVPSKPERDAYFWHAVLMGILTVVFVSTTVLGVREQESEIKISKKIGFFKGLKETWTFRPYVLLVMVTVLGWLSLQFIQGNLALYIKYSLGKGTEYPYIITCLIISTVCSLVFWQFIIMKFGKKTAYFWGIWSLVPILLSQLYLDRAPWLAYVSNILAGVGVGALYLLPWSMLPDVIDASILKFSVRREELFYAYFVFGNKFGNGFTLAVSTAILKLVGYDETMCEQPWLVSLMLKITVTVPSLLFFMVGLPFLYHYPITEAVRERMKKLLEDRRERAVGQRDNEEPCGTATSVAAQYKESTATSDSPFQTKKVLTQTYL